jgi:2-methylcitrate dehydratase PrpD
MATAGATEYPRPGPRRSAEDLPERVIRGGQRPGDERYAPHAGAETEEGRIVGEVVKGWGAGDRATLIPCGARGTLHQAIYANAALSMALDYDDYLFAGHTGHSAVLVSLALCEALGRPGRDWLLAQVIANEIEGRIGASVLLGPLNGQLWSFIHLAGGAVIAGRLLGLDAARIRSALGIAFLQPPHGLWAPFFGSGSKTILGAGPAVAGVQAAELAAAGLEGCADVLESTQGFVAAFTPDPLPGAYGGLGRTWLTETLCYKIYPGCAYVDTAVDSVLSLVSRAPIDPARVKGIEVEAGPLTLGMEGLSLMHLRGPESTPVTLNFSVPTTWPWRSSIASSRRASSRRRGSIRRSGEPLGR